MNPRSRLSRAQNAGFTLVEMLVLLGLFSIILLASFPALRMAMTKARLETTVQQTATVLYGARLRAIREATTAYVTFEDDDDGKRLWATLDRNRDGDFDTHLGDVQIGDWIEVTGPPLDVDAVDGFAANRVEFRSDGTVALPGAFRIAGVIGEELQFYEVRVAPAAAPRISVRRWDKDEEEWVEEGVN